MDQRPHKSTNLLRDRDYFSLLKVLAYVWEEIEANQKHKKVKNSDKCMYITTNYISN